MNSRATIAILISGRGSNMAALIDACENPEYPAQVIQVISDNASAAGLEIAKKAKINTSAIARKDYPTKDAHEAAILAQLSNTQPDLICLAGFMRILSPKFVACYPGKILNIHPSLLPKYPGLNTHARALAAADKEHGCSVHIVTDGLDEGPVVAQSCLRVEKYDNAMTLQEKVLKLEHSLYVEAVRKVLNKS